MDNHLINQTEIMKSLDSFIDSQLTCKKHVEYV